MAVERSSSVFASDAGVQSKISSRGEKEEREDQTEGEEGEGGGGPKKIKKIMSKTMEGKKKKSRRKKGLSPSFFARS
jgi:hypothetical protein